MSDETPRRLPRPHPSDVVAHARRVLGTAWRVRYISLTETFEARHGDYAAFGHTATTLVARAQRMAASGLLAEIDEDLPPDPDTREVRKTHD